MFVVLHLLACLWISHLSQADAVWKVDDIVEDVKSKPLPTLVSEFTQKMTGEFDQLYHQMEGLLGQVKQGWGQQEVETRLDPDTLSRCVCDCRCPHDADPGSRMTEVKQSVLALKQRVESVGKSLKDKIHQITSR